MRLLIFTAAIAVILFAYGYRINQMQGEVRDNHDRIAELDCVHYIYEDGSAIHIDAEVALECLKRVLGWTDFQVDPAEQ